MNYLDDYRCIPWVLSKPVSRHVEEVKGSQEESFADLPRKLPTIWGSFIRERKFIIIKMEKKFLDRAAEFLEKHFFNNDILCKGVSLIYDQTAVDYYKDLMKYWLKDRTSLLAIEEGNERLVGVLIARIIYLVSGLNLDIDYSRIGICNQRVQEIQDLRVNMRKEIIKVTSLERAEERCFEIKVLCVDHVELIADDIEKKLIKSLYVLASEAKVSLIIGVMTSLHDQEMFKAEGFKQAYRAKYDDLKKRNYVLFPSKDPENHIIGFYKFIEGVHKSQYVEESITSKRIPLGELPVESFSEDSLTDSDEEPYRMIKLYLARDEVDSDDDWYSSEEEDESYKDIRKLMVEYREEVLAQEGEEEEEEELGEFSGTADLSEEEFLSE